MCSLIVWVLEEGERVGQHLISQLIASRPLVSDAVIALTASWRRQATCTVASSTRPGRPRRVGRRTVCRDDTYDYLLPWLSREVSLPRGERYIILVVSTNGHRGWSCSRERRVIHVARCPTTQTDWSGSPSCKAPTQTRDNPSADSRFPTSSPFIPAWCQPPCRDFFPAFVWDWYREIWGFSPVVTRARTLSRFRPRLRPRQRQFPWEWRRNHR